MGLLLQAHEKNDKSRNKRAMYRRTIWATIGIRKSLTKSNICLQYGLVVARPVCAQIVSWAECRRKFGRQTLFCRPNFLLHYAQLNLTKLRRFCRPNCSPVYSALISRLVIFSENDTFVAQIFSCTLPNSTQ